MLSSRDLNEAPASHAPAPRHTSLPTLFRKSCTSDSPPMRPGSATPRDPGAANGTRTPSISLNFH
eukprot:4848603-Heterocapsa_arctica.AAC.1